MRIIKSAMVMTSIALLASIQLGRAQINVGFNMISGTVSSVAGGDGNVNDGNYSTIGGGTGNEIASGATEAFIGGGIQNTINAGGDWSSILGGYLNVINNIFGSIGNANAATISSDYGTIAGGAVNTIATDSVFSTIGGGAFNSITKSNATIAGGVSNIVAGKYSSIPGGHKAKTRNTGQFALANGAFSEIGDAQMGIYIFRGVTTTANWTELFLDGVSERLAIPPNASWLCDIQIVSRGTVTQNGMRGNYWRREVAVENTGGTMVGADLGGTGSTTAVNFLHTWSALFYPNSHEHVYDIPQLAVQVSDATSKVARPGLAASVVADSTHDALTISVKGNAGEEVHWVVTVRTTELIKP